MAQEIIVLFENGTDGKDVEDCIIGLTTDGELADEWVSKDMQYREQKTLILNQIPCAECGNNWKSKVD
jgi:hypothetical protein